MSRRREARARRHREVPAVDLTTRIGSVTLPNPVMTASGTAGHGAELGPYLDLAELGAVVVKSLAPYPWPGNPAPRLYPTRGGLLNAVGLQGPGLEAWLLDDLPGLLSTGARVVASIWGRTVEEFGEAADLLADAPTSVVAVEVNLSCPNLEDGRHMFAHSPAASRAVMEATAGCRRPRWAKLSPNTADLPEMAAAARDGGAEAVTLVNTLLGLALDPDTGRPELGHGGGGLSGSAMHPVAVRAVYDVRTALPELPVVGVGGVSSGRDAAELLMAGADAVQVGTATFADPRAPALVLEELAAWAERRGVARIADVVGVAHRGGLG
ncbi:MAG: dihydroorotate dehydrogenase [Acidimicrobiales bacterium]